jgi:cellulase (glycosyl hydrolase family 5)
MGDLTLNSVLRARPAVTLATLSRSARPRLLLALVACAAAVLALASPGDARAASRRAVGPPGISVLGSQLLKNGVPWIPRGVQIVGLVAPNDALGGKYIAAHQNFSAHELSQAAADGADTVRFQVSNFGLDPNSTIYSPAYVREVQNGVELARSLGLSVIVSVQAEGPAGLNSRCPLPDTGTERVWTELALMFRADPGVMFELYNEPGLNATARNWQIWLNGGTLTQNNGQPCQAVGAQSLVDVIRSEGADNVVILPGLSGELTLSGMPTVVDPSNPANPQLAYGIHYPTLTGGISRWNRAFGTLAAVHPVIITEWDQNSTHDCIANAPTASTLLLGYLMSKQIGLVGFAFDLPGTIISDYMSYQPTTFDSFACGVPNGGPGALLFGEYAGLAQAIGPTQVIGSPAWAVTNTALKALERLDPPQAVHLFDSPRTYVVGGNAKTLTNLSTPAALATAKFTSETALAAAVTSRTLPLGTRAVMFDDEFGLQTPRVEQAHPGTYFTRAANVAHRAGLLLVAAPSASLVYARAPTTRPSQLYSQFLKMNIAATVAKTADVLQIDAQGNEGHPSRYASFVQAASLQAIAAHPGIELLAGISTNPNGREQTEQKLLNSALKTRVMVAGFGLNDPGSSKLCKGCGRWYAAVANSFLTELSIRGG